MVYMDVPSGTTGGFIMTRDTNPFDGRRPTPDDITQEFWGEDIAWGGAATSSTPSMAEEPPAPPASHTVPLVSEDAPARPRRRRRRVAASAAAAHRAPIDPLLARAQAGGAAASAPQQRRVADPLVVRVSAVLAAFLIVLPFILSKNSDPEVIAAAALPTTQVADAVTVTAPVLTEPQPSVTEVIELTTVPVTTVATTPAPAAQPSAQPVSQSAARPASQPASSTTSAAQTAQTAQTAAPARADECAQRYVVGPGDGWYRIANEAKIDTDRVLALNNADVSTEIHPGDKICLPADATMPSTPTTTTAVSTTVAATTTDAPATTAAATTTATPTTLGSGAYLTPEQVKALIREIWPEELHEKALQVAWRESNYIPTADNGRCCHGVFQIYYTVHQSWLPDYGIYSVNDLYDARKNITAAYALYQRAGGWGPWGG